MKGLQHLSSLRNIKSIHTVGAGSIPKVQRSTYLELYILGREKDRLEKEMRLLEKRKDAAGNHLSSVTKRLKRLQKEATGKTMERSLNGAHSRILKSVALHY